MSSPLRRLQATVLVSGAAVLALSAGVGYYCWKQQQKQRRCSEAAKADEAALRHRLLRVRLLFGSTTGTSEKWARRVKAECTKRLAAALPEVRVEFLVESLATFAFDSLLEPASAECLDIVLILLSTQAEGKAPPNCDHFCTLLEDHVHDFRVGKAAFSHLDIAVLGFGSSDYEGAGHYCTAALGVDAGLVSLGARRLLPAARVTDTRDADGQVEPWLELLVESLVRRTQGGSDSIRADATPIDLGEEDSESEAESTSAGSPEVGEVEELAESCAGTALDKDSRKEPREMLTKRHREQLVKEGYKIVGSHSAVKLCRWTKHQLRGRGGCYKHSFYGITSYQCMEATPSLACANKCVFCWRHHKNPTGTEWRWKMDDPADIVRHGIEAHRKMIREAKGIPGVKPERLEVAMTPRHCALSLVGEPIMYPRINELVDELHRRRISTFLVTNAQFPEAMDVLHPVTQLYISVDAATRDALKAIDRPIFTDFWDRYMACMRSLAQKRERTTYRLTLVKDRNMSDAADYARLVKMGQPDFIEIKSVTFCGESKASNLTIGNVPWHEEVKQFSEAMLACEGLGEQYELACEHQHSCIVLIANRRFKINGTWHTWIDYDRFHDLVASGEPFNALDYCAETPAWALYNSQEQGFDPEEKRVFHNRTKRKAQDGLLSDVQLRQYPVNPALA